MSGVVRRCALGALLSSVLVAPAFAQVFRSQTELVRLDVSVTRGETPVDGLTAGDFVVTDNGVEQTVDSLSGERTPLQVQIAFDASSSVSGRRLRSLLADHRPARHFLLGLTAVTAVVAALTDWT